MSSSATADQHPSGPAGGDPGRRPRPQFLLLGVILAALVAVVLFGVVGSGTGSSGGRPQAGSPVPAFTLANLRGGGRVGVPGDGGGGGRPAILLFFASWCGPCQQEVPALARAERRQHQDRSPLAKVSMIGVDVSDPRSSALAFVSKAKVTFPVGVDSTYAVASGLFGFTNLPESVFVEGNGTIAGVHLGALSPSALVSWEHRLLGS